MAETTCCPAPKQQDPAESVAAAPALTVSSETKSRTTKKPEAILPISLRLIMEELLKLPEFSWEEIKKHTDAQSCWCVFHGLVYDLTKFLKLHPGGSHVILEVAGQDATDTFEDIGHTLEARIMADEYIVGRVKGETNLRRCKPENAKECSANAPPRMSRGSASTSLIVVMIVVALIGIWAYYQFQDDGSTLYQHFSTVPQQRV